MKGSFIVDKTWDGRPIPASDRASVEFDLGGGSLRLSIDAPFYGDPAPPGPPGRTDRLWEFEAVEAFFAGTEARYLELEFGPHGHFLGLFFEGERNLARDRIDLEFRAVVDQKRWRGAAIVPDSALPPGLDKGNAYALHGTGAGRVFLAAHPVPGDKPDFHTLSRFKPLS